MMSTADLRTSRASILQYRTEQNRTVQRSAELHIVIVQSDITLQNK